MGEICTIMGKIGIIMGKIGISSTGLYGCLP